MSIQDAGGALQNEVLTVKEVAAYLRVSRVTVWRWCQEGKIPASRVGRNWRILRKDVLDLLQSSQPLNLKPVSTSLPAGQDGNTIEIPVIVLEPEETLECGDNPDDDANLDSDEICE